MPTCAGKPVEIPAELAFHICNSPLTWLTTGQADWEVGDCSPLCSSVCGVRACRPGGLRCTRASACRGEATQSSPAGALWPGHSLDSISAGAKASRTWTHDGRLSGGGRVAGVRASVPPLRTAGVRCSGAGPGGTRGVAASPAVFCKSARIHANSKRKAGRAGQGQGLGRDTAWMRRRRWWCLGERLLHNCGLSRAKHRAAAGCAGMASLRASAAASGASGATAQPSRQCADHIAERHLRD